MRKALLASILFVTIAGSAFAQEFRTGYFLENYSYGYRINSGAPIEGKPYFFAGLGLGNVSLDARTNLSVPSFLSPYTAADGTTSLVFPLLLSDFSLEEAIAGFSADNNAAVRMNLNLLTVGHQSDFNRWSAEINLHGNAMVGIPIDFFSIAKTGLLHIADDSWEWTDRYSFAGLHASVDSYAEIALGYSHKIGERLTIGGRVKGLLGLAYVGLDLEAAAAPGVTKDVKAEVDGSVMIASPISLDLPSYQSGGKTYYDTEALINGFDFLSLLNGKKGPCGWGLGFDLGVTYELIDGLYLSAAANDLGFISWNGIGVGYHIDNELGDDNYREELLRFENISGKFTSGLDYSFVLGAKYKMPFYDRLSAGLLGTFQKYYSEARLGLDITPLDFISVAASAAIGTYGFNFGAALNLKFPIVNFFIGTDAMMYNFTPQMIPLDEINTMVTAGLLIAI
ncbi:MAG: hypothetical protein IK031_06365 [Bacteroidales bacterium]|nr:hypothetical protein [Bacteroidales bacterium]